MHFIDLAAQRRRLGDRLNQAILDVVEGGRYILGPEVAKFEAEMSSYLGVRNTVACANGTDALLLPLLAFDVGPGDAVFVPSFTFAATAEVVALAKAEPVFVDVDPDTYNIDLQSLQAAIDMVRAEGRLAPRAIISVDLFGLSADYSNLADIAGREGLILIEDAAQSMGGKRFNRMCGSFGTVGATSFYPAKPLGCYGDGGAMFTDDDQLAEKLRSLAFHGKGETQYDNVYVGLNSRLDTIQAAILLEKLSILESEMEARESVARRYNQDLAEFVKVPILMEGHRSAWAQYAIQSERRDELRQHLQQQGVPTVIYYVKPLHLQPAYEAYPRTPAGLAVSETLPTTILCLPMHPYLTADDQSQIVEAVRSFHKSS